MRKLAGCLLLFVMLAGSGCLQLPGHTRQPATSPPVVAAKPVRVPAPVTAEQVTEANAHAKATALEEEMAREEQSDLPAPRAVAKPSK